MSKARSRFTPEYEVMIELLIAKRKAARITQLQVATVLDKPQSHISKCESRDREISIIDLLKWCQALDTTLSAFAEEFENDLMHQKGNADPSHIQMPELTP